MEKKDFKIGKVYKWDPNKSALTNERFEFVGISPENGDPYFKEISFEHFPYSKLVFGKFIGCVSFPYSYNDMILA